MKNIIIPASIAIVVFVCFSCRPCFSAEDQDRDVGQKEVSEVEEISAEDREIIENFELFENLDLFMEKDLEMFENFELFLADS